MNEHESPLPPPDARAATDDGAPALESLVLLVVGAHLRAELHDRPAAYRLRAGIMSRQAGNGDVVVEPQPCSAAHPGRAPGHAAALLHPVVCTDLWYLNDLALQGRPAICLGDPSVNAASAYLSNRLPTALVIEDLLRIHLDPEFIDPQACVWGVNAKATESAVDLFIERYLDMFLRTAG
jgi:hypothetical protein